MRNIPQYVPIRSEPKPLSSEEKLAVVARYAAIGFIVLATISIAIFTGLI
jgi:hypothetical protein